MTRNALIVTCEHGGCSIPEAYAPLFAGQEALLRTHRGWDAGALALARQMAALLQAPLFYSETSRLVADLNRSVGHYQLYSEFTRGVPPAAKREMLEAHYFPHRLAVESAIAQAVAAGSRVVHIGSHSFTPELHGVVRSADVGLLYDPRRPGEQALSIAWLRALGRLEPALRLRRNYPYQGKANGLASSLRRRYTAQQYVGIELEVNQRFVEAGGPAFAAVCDAVTAALGEALEEAPG